MAQPGGAGPGAPPGAPLARPRAYATLFGEPERDAYRGDYTPIHAVFTVTAGAGGQPPSPAQLFARAQAWATRPASLAYVALVDRGAGPMVETWLNPFLHSRPRSHGPNSSLR